MRGGCTTRSAFFRSSSSAGHCQVNRAVGRIGGLSEESSVSTSVALCRRHRFPGEIISYAVWLYYRFTLSYRDIEVLRAERGVPVTGIVNLTL